MNWKLVREAVDAGTRIDDWSKWQIMAEPQPCILDRIYDDLAAQGKTEGVIKLGPGQYLAQGGSWLF